MADWTGTARTNFFNAENIGGLRTSLDRFEGQIEIVENGERVCLTPATDDGDFPVKVICLDGTELEFDFANDVMPFVAEGEVLVVQGVGNEGPGFVSGYAQAFIRHGEDVQDVELLLENIYQKAADAFHVDKDDIARAVYNEYPANVVRRQANAPRG